MTKTTRRTHYTVPTNRVLACFLAGLVLVLLSAVGAVYLNAINTEKFETALLSTIDPASLGTDETSIRSFARETISYLNDSKDEWAPQIYVMGLPADSFIPQSFRDHMEVVKVWVDSAKSIFLGGAALVLGCLMLVFFGRKIAFSPLAYYGGALLPIAIGGGITLWATLDFESFWRVLHEYLIPDGIFAATETIMQLFPLDAFASYLPSVGMMFGIACIAILILPLPLMLVAHLLHALGIKGK